MTYNYKRAEKIAHKVGNQHLSSRKNVIFENYPTDKRGQPAFYSVAKKVYSAYFKAESTRHIHTAGVAAAHAAYIRLFKVRNKHGEIEAADKITNYRAQQKPIPAVAESYAFDGSLKQSRHFSEFSLISNRIGVPEKSKFFLMTFSRKRS